MKITSLKILSTGLLLGAAALSACTKKEDAPSTSSTTNAATVAPDSGAQVKELKIEDSKVGTGAVGTAGKKVFVHYTGTLLNGEKFDSSKDRDEPFDFVLGRGMVIPGWDQGIEGMKVGGQRRLTIPANLAYGERGAPPRIPPNSPLIFEVELLKVE